MSATDYVNEEDLDDEAMDVELDPLSQEFLDNLIDRCIVFMNALCVSTLFPYQQIFARRLFESIVLNDGETLTGLFSRQSGKTETVANVIATVMVLFPRLAKMEIFRELLAKFENGVMVGTFAPVEDQAETLYSRIVSNLTSDRALEIMLDSEIDDAPVGGGKLIRLKRSGSFCRMQTCNPRAKIESKSYHVICIDEAQDAEEFVVNKSIVPMGTFYNATMVMTGTPTYTKGVFYKTIQYNKRRQTRARRQNHFEFDWRFCAKYNNNYAISVKKTMLRIGEDSDEFQLAYALKWLLERGMFTTETEVEYLGDKSMEVVKAWHRTPCVVGIDPARKQDSTVVTVLYVDWDHPDEFGFYDHRVLNWLEIHGDDWEEQYFQIVNFLSNYWIVRGGVDVQGVGDAVCSRLKVLMPEIEWVECGSNNSEQSERWKHLMQLMQRRLVGWPWHAKTRRLRAHKRFVQQMVDLEKNYQGKFLIAAAPDENEAHDDYPDSLAIACYMTKDDTAPEVEQATNPFYSRSR